MKHIYKPAHWRDRLGHYLMPEIFLGMGPKTSSVGGNLRGNCLLHRKSEKELSCEGEDMAGEEEKKVCVQYIERKGAAGVGCINQPAQIRRKYSRCGR